MTLQAGGNIGGQTPDVGSAAEVTIDTTSLSADLPTGGVRINFIPRDGGNRFANSAFFTFANEGLQGNNFSDELKAAGLATPTKIVSNFDLNEAFGGPIKRDKVWFWFSTRYNAREERGRHLRERQCLQAERVALRADDDAGGQRGRSSSTTAFASPGRRTRSSRSPAPTRPTSGATVRARSARRARLRRRATGDSRVCGRSTPRSTSPITNKLLFEAVGLHLFERWGDMHLRVNGGSLDDPAHEALLPQLISVTEQSNNLIYRARENNNNTLVPNWSYRAAMSYVTGTHAFKVGFNRTHGFLEEYQYAMNPVSYRFNNGVPNQITRRVDAVHGDLEPGQRSRALRAGSLDPGPADAEPGAAVRLVPDQLPRADGRTGAARRRPATSPSRRPTTSTGRTSPTGPASSMTWAATARPPSRSRSTSTCSVRR